MAIHCENVTLQPNEVTQIEKQFQNPKIVAQASRLCCEKTIFSRTGETPVPPGISAATPFGWTLTFFWIPGFLRDPFFLFFVIRIGLFQKTEVLQSFLYSWFPGFLRGLIFRDYDRIISESWSVTNFGNPRNLSSVRSHPNPVVNSVTDNCISRLIRWLCGVSSIITACRYVASSSQGVAWQVLGGS